MSDSTRAALAASIAAGYLLGRSGKAKLALALAGYLASQKLRAKPQDLLAMALGKLGDSPQLSQLTDQVRGEVLSVGRDALKAVADRRLGAFADSLADRTKSLSDAMDAVGEELDEDGEDKEEEEGEEEEPEGEGDRGRPKAKSARPDRPRRDSAERSAPARKPAKKAPPKKTAKKPEKKTAKKTPAEQSRRRR